MPPSSNKYRDTVIHVLKVLVSDPSPSFPHMKNVGRFCDLIEPPELLDAVVNAGAISAEERQMLDDISHHLELVAQGSGSGNPDRMKPFAESPVWQPVRRSAQAALDVLTASS